MNLSLKLTFAHSRVQSKDPAWNYQFLLNNYMPLIKMTSGRWPNTFICLANNIYWAKRNFFSPTYIWSDTEMFDRPDVTIVRYVGWVGGIILKHLWLKKDWFDRLLTTLVTVFHSVVINIFQIKVVVIRENWYAD